MFLPATMHGVVDTLHCRTQNTVAPGRCNTATQTYAGRTVRERIHARSPGIQKFVRFSATPEDGAQTIQIGQALIFNWALECNAKRSAGPLLVEVTVIESSWGLKLAGAGDEEWGWMYRRRWSTWGCPRRRRCGTCCTRCSPAAPAPARDCSLCYHARPGVLAGASAFTSQTA